MVSLFPSLISANLLNLQKEIEILEPFCAGFHLDIMDFHFVPNLTWGPPFVQAIRKATSHQLFVHLMVEYPERYISRLQLKPHDIVSFHIESPTKLSWQALAQLIKAQEYIPSIALNPATPLEKLIHAPLSLEHVLLMSVHPGFSGQQFLPYSIDKLKALNLWKEAHNLSFTIAVDGGIDQYNIQELKRNGATQFAVASAIFSHKDRIKAIKALGF